MRARAALLAALLAPLASACEEPLSSPDLLTILACGDAADTIEAELLQAVVVEVRREGGEPAADIVVRFDPLMAGEPAYPTVLVSTLKGDGYVPGIVEIADARGRASVRVRLGGVAGPAGLLVTVPELGLQDTARFTVLPGAAVAVTVEPPDTALYVGGSYPLRAATVDRRGNPREDSLSYTAAGDVVTVDPSGNVVGQTIGRGTVVVQAAGAVDTARVSVVPQGRLAARQGYFEPALVVFDLDGSGFDTVVSLPRGMGYMSPDWSPTGDGFVLYTYESGAERIYLVDGSGNRRRLLPTNVGIDRERWPRFSSAGDWVYFIGEQNFQDAVWRVRPDGSGLVRVGPLLSQYTNAAMLAVAPDAARHHNVTAPLIPRRRPVLASPTLGLRSGAPARAAQRRPGLGAELL